MFFKNELLSNLLAKNERNKSQMKFQFHDSTRYFDAVVSEVVVDQEDWAESASLLQYSPGAGPGPMRETSTRGFLVSVA